MTAYRVAVVILTGIVVLFVLDLVVVAFTAPTLGGPIPTSVTAPQR